MEDYDEELAALVRKNVTMLSEIQEDLSDLKEAHYAGVWGVRIGSHLAAEILQEKHFDPICNMFNYGVATSSRLLKIIGLFCRISSL